MSKQQRPPPIASWCSGPTSPLGEEYERLATRHDSGAIVTFRRQGA